jgi:hypothetical protein
LPESRFGSWAKEAGEIDPDQCPTTLAKAAMLSPNNANCQRLMMRSPIRTTVSASMGTTCAHVRLQFSRTDHFHHHLPRVVRALSTVFVDFAIPPIELAN